MSESKFLEIMSYCQKWCLRNWKKGSIQNEKLQMLPQLLLCVVHAV